MVTMTAPKRKGTAGRPKAVQPKRQIISMRGSEEWREWLNALADHAHMPATTLIDQALLRYAQSVGFEQPMPKR